MQTKTETKSKFRKFTFGTNLIIYSLFFGAFCIFLPLFVIMIMGCATPNPTCPGGLPELFKGALYLWIIQIGFLPAFLLAFFNFLDGIWGLFRSLFLKKFREVGEYFLLIFLDLVIVYSFSLLRLSQENYTILTIEAQQILYFIYLNFYLQKKPKVQMTEKNNLTNS